MEKKKETVESTKIINKSAEEKVLVEHISAETASELDESTEIELLKKVEAALFISARFLSLQDLVMLTDINPLMLKELINKLKEKYNENSAVEIVEKKDLWKMDVRQEYVGMINKLATGNAEFTKAEQETLAVIAYKQPVKQSVIINIRGNKAYDHIKHFTDIGLVVGKRVGHTKELKLSDEFFEYFHLVNKDEVAQGLDFERIKEHAKVAEESEKDQESQEIEKSKILEEIQEDKNEPEKKIVEEKEVVKENNDLELGKSNDSLNKESNTPSLDSKVDNGVE
jgi:segregation and condensation protein B